MDSLAKIAARLAVTREALGLSAADLCREIKCKPNRWSQYESGERRITLAIASKLRERYGIPLDWTYCGDASVLPRRINIPDTAA